MCSARGCGVGSIGPSLGESAGVHSGDARYVSRRLMEVHRSGQRQHALDQRGASVGVCSPRCVGAEPGEGELAQPRGVSRRGHPAIGTHGPAIQDGRGGGSSARCGGAVSQSGTEAAREDVPRYGQSRASVEGEGPGVEARFLTRKMVRSRVTSR